MVTRRRGKERVGIRAGIREALNSVSTKFSKAAREKGITLEEILKDLKKIRCQRP